MPVSGITYNDRPVPVVAFYSVSGGVGKTTLARKFAELITIAPGLDEHRPNVLLVDLDVGSRGLTYRLAQRLRQNVKTVHEVMAQRSIQAAAALDVTSEVSLARGNPADSDRGKLYLMPAAPPETKGVFNTIANIPKDELLDLLHNMIENLVKEYDISCVIIDCAPGADPYVAAAATLSDVPLFIGRNEPTTYKQIGVLPARFQEWYSQFLPEKQRVIINAVAAKKIYEKQAEQYPIFDYIPQTSDVILETEGLPITQSLRMLLLEKYIVDIIKQVFIGRSDLIPRAPDVVGQEWIGILNQLCRCKEAPKIRLLRLLTHLRWAGVVLVVIGITFIVLRQVLNGIFPATLTNIGIGGVIVGILLLIAGWYAEREQRRILTAAQEMVRGGPDEIFRKLKEEGFSYRKKLNEMKKIAGTIPPEERPVLQEGILMQKSLQLQLVAHATKKRKEVMHNEQ